MASNLQIKIKTWKWKFKKMFVVNPNYLSLMLILQKM